MLSKTKKLLESHQSHTQPHPLHGEASGDFLGCAGTTIQKKKQWKQEYIFNKNERCRDIKNQKLK